MVHKTRSQYFLFISFKSTQRENEQRLNLRRRGFFWKENKGHLSNRQIRIRFLRLDFFLEGGASLHYIGFAVLQWSQNLFWGETCLKLQFISTIDISYNQLLWWITYSFSLRTIIQLNIIEHALLIWRYSRQGPLVLPLSPTETSRFLIEDVSFIFLPWQRYLS